MKTRAGHLILRIPSKTSRRNPRPVIIPIRAALAAMLTEARPDGRAIKPGTGFVTVKGKTS